MPRMLQHTRFHITWEAHPWSQLWVHKYKMQGRLIIRIMLEHSDQGDKQSSQQSNYYEGICSRFSFLLREFNSEIPERADRTPRMLRAFKIARDISSNCPVHISFLWVSQKWLCPMNPDFILLWQASGQEKAVSLKMSKQVTSKDANG